MPRSRHVVTCKGRHSVRASPSSHGSHDCPDEGDAGGPLFTYREREIDLVFTIITKITSHILRLLQAPMAAENVQISIDSELLTTLVSADPVSSGDHFTAIVDQNGAPAVFSLSTDGKLLFIVQDATALDDSYVSHDFGSLWGATDKVTGFDVLQTSDKRLAIALAVRKDDQHSVLLVLPSLAPADLLSPSLESVLGKSSSFPYIETVFMASSGPSRLLPVRMRLTIAE